MNKEEKQRYGEILRQQMKEKEEIKLKEKNFKRGVSLQKIGEPIEQTYYQQQKSIQITPIPLKNNYENIGRGRESSLTDQKSRIERENIFQNADHSLNTNKMPPKIPTPYFQNGEQQYYNQQRFQNAQENQFRVQEYEYQPQPWEHKHNYPPLNFNELKPEIKYPEYQIRPPEYEYERYQQEYQRNQPKYEPQYQPQYQRELQHQQEYALQAPQRNYQMQPQREYFQEPLREKEHYEELQEKIELPIPSENQIPRKQIQEPEEKKVRSNRLAMENTTDEQIIAKQKAKLEYQEELRRQMEINIAKKKEEKKQMMEYDLMLEKKAMKEIEEEKLKKLVEDKKEEQKKTEPAKQELVKNEPNLKAEKYKKIREEGRKKKNEEDIVAKEIVETKETSFENRKESAHKEDGGLSFELAKMHNQISNQGELFQRELERVRKEAELARQEKMRADEEVRKLKEALKKQMEDKNEELLSEMRPKPGYYADEHTFKMKPRKNEQLVVTNYEQISRKNKSRGNEQNGATRNNKHESDYNVSPAEMHKNNQVEINERSNYLENSELMSLDGESKKIPVDLETSKKLTLSTLGDYAKNPSYFVNKIKPQPTMIKEESEEMEGGKFSLGIEELDKLMEKREKSRSNWGVEMSSINEDVTKEIDELLNKRDVRPRSNLSRKGEQIVNYPSKREQKTIDGGYREFESEAISNNDLSKLDTLLYRYQQ